MRAIAEGVNRLRFRPIPSSAYAVGRWLLRGTSSARETMSASYCFDQWMQHERNLLPLAGRMPDAVAELGPGASLGVGMCALLSGAGRYVALDLVPHASLERDLTVFDDLVDVVGRRGQPAMVRRVPAVRSLLQSQGLEYVAPWNEPSAIAVESIDWVVSTAVLEHVDDVAGTWEAIATWLRPGGFAAHQIDFRSHGRAVAWNGHWAYPQWIWDRIKGRNSAINRAPLSRHVQCLEQAGLQLVRADPVTSTSGLVRGELHRDWRWLTDDDLTTESAYLIARKPSRGD